MSKRRPQNWSRKWLVLEKFSRKGIAFPDRGVPASFSREMFDVNESYIRHLFRRGWLSRKKQVLDDDSEVYVYWLSGKSQGFRKRFGGFLGPKNPFDRGYFPKGGGAMLRTLTN